MRDGFWRLHRIFRRLGISPTVTINVKVCETYPQVRTTSTPIVALPYNFELHDIVLMVQGQSSDAVFRRAMDQFERLHEEAPSVPK